MDYEPEQDQDVSNMMQPTPALQSTAEAKFPTAVIPGGTTLFHELIDQYLSKSSDGKLREDLLKLITAGANKNANLQELILDANFKDIRTKAKAMKNLDGILEASKAHNLVSCKLELYAEACGRIFPALETEKQE